MECPFLTLSLKQKASLSLLVSILYPYHLFQNRVLWCRNLFHYKIVSRENRSNCDPLDYKNQPLWNALKTSFVPTSLKPGS